MKIDSSSLSSLLKLLFFAGLAFFSTISEGAITAPKSTTSRKTVTFSATLTADKENVESTVSLWYGETDDPATFIQAGYPVTLLSGTISMPVTLPDFDKTYYWQFRYILSDGTTPEVDRTEVLSCLTKDTTTYTWIGGNSGNWSDASCWQDNNNGDSLGYPVSPNASATFGIKTDAVILLTEPISISKLTINGGNLTLAQGGSDTNATKLTITTLSTPPPYLNLTLDNVAVKSGNISLARGATLLLKNQSNLRCAKVTNSGGNLLVLGDSYLYMGDLAFSKGSFLIRDSIATISGSAVLGSAHETSYIRFEGDHPRLVMPNTKTSIYASSTDAVVSLDFTVPEGGYAFPPFIYTSSYRLGSYNNTTRKSIKINVSGESPANKINASVSTPLISSPTGIDIPNGSIVLNNLPTIGNATDDEFFTDNPDGVPNLISVTINGSDNAGKILISSTENGADFFPALGLIETIEDDTLECTTYNGIIQINENERLRLAGWNLYTIDLLSSKKTLTCSGIGASASISCSPTTFQELEWDWVREFRITASSLGNGTVSVDNEWVQTGKAARITATANAGYGFMKWTGDAIPNYDKQASLSFAVEGKPYNLIANFSPFIYVSNSGNDANSGTSPTDSYATIEAAIAAHPGAYILLSDETHEITTTLIETTGATIAGANPDRKAKILAVTSKVRNQPTFPNDLAIRIENPETRLLNLTITSDFVSSSQQSRGMAGVRIVNGGLIDNCVISNFYMWGVGSSPNCGLYINGGIIRNSHLHKNTNRYSGGVWNHGQNINIAANSLVENCIISAGGAHNKGNNRSSVYMTAQTSTMRNCLIIDSICDPSTGPTALYVNGGTVENCTITRNVHDRSSNLSAVAINKDGSKQVVFRNNIISGNFDLSGERNWSSTELPPVFISENNLSNTYFPGTDNLKADPKFTDYDGGDFTLQYSKSINKGKILPWMIGAKDLAGNERILGGTPEPGCFEYTSTTLECSLSVEESTILEGNFVCLSSDVSSNPLALSYNWTLTDTFGNETTQSGMGLCEISQLLSPGKYSVSLSVTDETGVCATTRQENLILVAPKDIFVATDGANIIPYSSYTSGATNIFDALEYATSGTTIHLADGIHRIPKNIVLSEAITIKSENGPENCTIFGKIASTSSPYVTLISSGAVISSVTLSGKDETTRPEQYGAILIGQNGGTVTNCIITSHTTVGNAHIAALEIKGGHLVDSVVIDNIAKSSGGVSSEGGGIDMSGNGLIERCFIANNQATYGADANGSRGGGVYMTAGEIRSSVISNNFASIHASGLFVSGTGKVIDCRIINNRASTASYRGGSTLRMGDTALVDRTIISGTDDLGVDNAKGLVYISGGTLRSSVVYGNSASNGVAGVYITNGSIINTTIYNNQLHTTGDASGLFIANDTAKIINTIVANNPAPEGIAETVGSDSCFINSATPSGIGLNGIIAPQFPFSFEENFILKKNSRLRNSGFYQLWMNDNPDFYGRPRIEGACVDIGATECYLPRATFFLLK